MIKKEKELEKASWTKSKKCCKIVGFGYLALVVVFMSIPYALMHYVKYEIRQGNWGDFTPEAPKFEEEEEEEDFNDAFVDIEKDFDDEDKEEPDEASKDADDKNSTVSEETKSDSEEKSENDSEKSDETPKAEEQKQHVNEDL